MTWILSYIGGNFGLILFTVLAVVALCAVAWFAKNWKVVVAAVAILAAGFIYMQIDKSAYQRRVAEEAAAQVKLLNDRIVVMEIVSKNDGARAAINQEYITKLEEEASDTPKNAGVCLDAAGARRVRSIGGTGPRATPLPPRRVPNVLPWRNRRPK